MKRSIALAVGVLTLGAAIYLGSRLGAQGPARPAASAQTRIAVLNLRWVIKHYAKYENFIKEMQEKDKSFVSQLQAKQKEMEALAKRAEAATGEQERAKMEQQLRNLQRDMEDIKLEARKQVTQRSNDEMVRVYKEVRAAAYRHAQANNIDLVLHFEGPAEEKETDSPVLVMRNINAGGAVPLYWNSALDISGHVLNTLNAAYKNGASGTR